jgi:aminopeptidase N
VSFDWQKSQLIGKAELQVKPYFYATNMLYLNARGMEIKTVKLAEKQVKALPVKKGGKSAVTEDILTEKPITYKYENDSIKINLGKEYNAKEVYYITIEYISKPNELRKGGSGAITDDKGLYFINPTGSDPDKMPQIWTQGETQSNSAWFPTIDNPTEKMTNEIYMTVDEKYTTLSNGLLTDSKKNSDGTRTDHWVMDLPHAPYLVMMGVGEFKKVTDEPWNGKEISYYVEKEYEPHAKAIFGKTKKMIEFYSNRLGVAYPWQKYAQIVARDYVSGAMENTTATLHGDFVCYQTTREIIDGAKGESTIAHELFHQWFGDLASCESWSNLTLNESFATYGEYLWEEFEYGRDAADDHHAGSRFGYFAQSNQKQVDLVRFDYAEREDMFDAFSYNKGGQILHMLRKYVGDDAFFASLKIYLEKNKFKTAEAHELRLAFEEVTGEDLNWFFNEW